MKNEELLNYAMDNIDQKYVDETAEALYNRTGKERRVYEIKVTRSPAPKKKGYKWAMGIAASVAVVAGVGVIAAVLPKTEWSRPSAASQGIEITLPATEKPLIENEPTVYETYETAEEPVSEDETVEYGDDYPVPPDDIKGRWLGGNGGDYLYAVNYNDDGSTGEIIAFNAVTGETITKKCDEAASVAAVYKNGVISLKTTDNGDRIASTAVYDEKLNFLYEATVPDENYSFIEPQWDGKYLWAFYDNNESLKRNDRSCAIYLHKPDGSSEPSLFKSVTLPQYICSVAAASYDENKEEIAFFGQKFAEGTDISEGFKSVFCIIDTETGNVTLEREYDEYYFSKASFEGGLIITLMRKNADEEYNAHPIILYYDGTECDFGSIISATGACSISPNGKYFAIQGGHSITGGDSGKNGKYSIMVYEINNRTLSDTPKVCYAGIDEGTSFLTGNNGLVYGVVNGKLEAFIPTEANSPEITLDDVYAIAERADSITIEELLGNYKTEAGSEVYSFVCPVSGELPLLISVGDKDGKGNPDTIYLGSNISDHAINLKTLTREDIELYVETIETLQSLKKHIESEISETTDTIEEHKAYLAELEKIKADAEYFKDRLEVENEIATRNNPEADGAYEKDIKYLEEYIADIDKKIEEAKERIKSFEAIITDLEEKAKEDSGVSDEEEGEGYQINMHIRTIINDALDYVCHSESEINRLKERISYLEGLKEQMREKEDFEKYEEKINERIEEIEKDIVVYEYNIKKAHEVVSNLKENPKVEYNTTTKIHSIEEVLLEAERTIQYREGDIQRLEERRSYLNNLKEQMKDKEDYEKYEARINEELLEIKKQIIINEQKIEEESAIVIELKLKLITEEN